jgi:hypothetical protein
MKTGTKNRGERFFFTFFPNARENKNRVLEGKNGEKMDRAELRGWGKSFFPSRDC